MAGQSMGGAGREKRVQPGWRGEQQHNSWNAGTAPHTPIAHILTAAVLTISLCLSDTSMEVDEVM